MGIRVNRLRWCSDIPVCRYRLQVYIADCDVHSGDDCVPIGKYSSNVLVERVRCSCGNGASPIIWATGQDPDAYITNVTFRDMTFTGTKFGANIKSLGSYLGTLQNVSFENIVLHDVGKAINIDLVGQGKFQLLHSAPPYPFLRGKIHTGVIHGV